MTKKIAYYIILQLKPHQEMSVKMDSEVETRVQELCNTTTASFTRVVLNELEDNVDEVTKAALSDPSLSQRWLSILDAQVVKSNRSLQSLLRDKINRGGKSDTIRRLRVFLRIAEQKQLDVQWLVTQQKRERRLLQEQVAEQRKQEKREAARLQLEREEQRALGIQKELDRRRTPGFKKRALHELARRHTDEFLAIITEIMTDDGVEPKPENLEKMLRDMQ